MQYCTVCYIYQNVKTWDCVSQLCLIVIMYMKRTSVLHLFSLLHYITMKANVLE